MPLFDTKEKLYEFIGEAVKEAMGATLKDLQENAKKRASPASGIIQAATEKAGKFPKEAPGLNFVRAARCLASAGGNHSAAVDIAAKHYGEDAGVTKALSAGTGSTGGYAVPEEFSEEFIELLRPKSVIRALGPVELPNPTGILHVPKVVGGATASYVGENSNGTSSDLTFGELVLAWKKLIALVAASNDWLRFTAAGMGPNGDMIIRNDLLGAMSQTENTKFIRGNGTAGAPRGLYYWAPSGQKSNANTTVSLANVTADLRTLLGYLEDSDCQLIKPAWISSPRTFRYLRTVQTSNGDYAFKGEMDQGTLWGFPFAGTNAIPKNLGGSSTGTELYLVDMADAVIGESNQVEIEMGDHAYYDSSASAVVSSFSRDQKVIRAVSRHDFGMRHDNSVGVLEDVRWGA